MGIFFDFGGIKGGGGLMDGLSGGKLGANFSSPDVKMQPVATPAPVATPKVVSAGQPAGSSNIMSIIDSTAAKYGVPADWMRKSAKIESNFNPNTVSSTGAKGLFQFTKGTGKTYGLADPFDPAQNADAAARLYLDNSNGLKKRLGRDPTGGEVYLAHQQGMAGASALLARPGDNVVDALSVAYKGNRAAAANAVKVNGGSIDMTAGAFAGKWTGKFDGMDDVQGSAVRTANSDVSKWRNSASDGAAPPAGQPGADAIAPPPGMAEQTAPGLGLVKRVADIGSSFAGASGGGNGGGGSKPPAMLPVGVSDIAPSIDEQLAALNAQEPGRYIAMPVSQFELMQQG